MPSHNGWSPTWAQPSEIQSGQQLQIPYDFLRGVKPVKCHSHDDYRRDIPLFEALHYGCISIEADVWVSPDKQELFVGHGRESLSSKKTLTSMYLNPLLHMLDQRNRPASHAPSSHIIGKVGLFDEDPHQTLVLLVDFKDDGHETFPILFKQLQHLRRRGYLTFYHNHKIVPGPVTVVVSGNAPFNLVLLLQDRREIFFDAHLSQLDKSKSQCQGYAEDSAFDETNSYYASVSYKTSIKNGWASLLPPDEQQQQKMREQIQNAHRNGLRVRYWATPGWPDYLRNSLWRTQRELGVDVINTDDIQEFSEGKWKRSEQLGCF